MITDDRLRHLSTPDYAQSEPGQLAAELLRARASLRTIAADHWDIAGCGTIRQFAKRALALETFVKPHPMLTTTKCWKCSGGYDITAPACPHCGAVNANIDPDKASADCLAFQSKAGRAR